MRSAGVVDPFMIPVRDDHVRGAAEEEYFVGVGNLADFFIPMIRWPDHLFVCPVGKHDVPAAFAHHDSSGSHLDDVVRALHVGGVGEKIHRAEVTGVVHACEPARVVLNTVRRG